MIYRRPSDFDSALRLLLALQHANVSGEQDQLRNAVMTLSELQWYNHALKPLYHANAVVKLVANSLVPTIQELVLESHVLSEAHKNITEETQKKRTMEFQALRANLVKACEKSKGREVSPEFARMRDAMHVYASHDEVQRILCSIFCLMSSARLALRLMTERICESLNKDTEIVVSDDIPMSALKLS